MPKKQETESQQQEEAARVIQKAWRRFLNLAVFEHFKSLINLKRQGEPRHILKYFNPKEAELLDAAAGIHVRFRLGGDKFPPDIYYKIFTHRHIEDLCANSPRDYTKLSAKHVSHNKTNEVQEEDRSGWYHRIENNGWRIVSDKFWILGESEIAQGKKESEFHFSKLKRRQDLERKRKIKKIEWMRQMYYTGTLKAKATRDETLNLIHTATKGLVRAVEDGGIDSVMEWEVAEVLNWTNALDFDEYIASWKEIATSNSSANFQGFRFEQEQKDTYNYEDVQHLQMGVPYDHFFENIYDQSNFGRLTPDSTYGL
ncbi:protein MFI isoform X1 [Ochotona princeps]|uniref:protein MFI isoform X1 n=1 Tax=Ochotona princeps TaxID=9978 RepID=UPI0027144DB5|nr:protein MFI isoform X1 [Ochotona princeps]